MKKNDDSPNAFFMQIKVKPVVDDKDGKDIDGKNLDPIERVSYYCLPSDFIVNSSLLTMICAVNLHKQKLIDQDITNVDSDIIICQLQRCLNHTDINLLMAECWSDYYSPAANVEKFKGLAMTDRLAALEGQMKSLVGQIYENIFNNNKQFHLDEIYPTRPSQLSAVEFLYQEKQFKEKVLDLIVRSVEADSKDSKDWTINTATAKKAEAAREASQKGF